MIRTQCYVIKDNMVYHKTVVQNSSKDDHPLVTYVAMCSMDEVVVFTPGQFVEYMNNLIREVRLSTLNNCKNAIKGAGDE